MKSLDTIPDYIGEPACVSELNDTNKHPFGKILVKISTLENFFCSSTFFVRISTGPYVVETRHITFDLNRYQLMKAKLEKEGTYLNNKNQLFSYMIDQ